MSQTEIIEVVQVTFSNSGGKLDSRVVEVTAENNTRSPIKAALMDMLAGIDLNSGDTITVEEI